MKITQLKWQTASETNNLGFEIQRSPDGLDWQPLGFVKGNGTTTDLSDYSFLDENPLAGANFYRLRQLDFDGNESYSSIERVDFDSKTDAFEISPNPVAAGGPVFFSIKNKLEGAAQLDIFDAAGRLVLSQKIELENKEQKQVELPTGPFAPGWHTARLRMGGQVFTQNFLVGGH